MSIQSAADDVDLVRTLLIDVQVGAREDVHEAMQEGIIKLEAIERSLRDPRGDYIEYEHDNGSDKITLDGIPVRGITKLSWIKLARGRPVVCFEATVRARIHDVTTR